MNKLPENQEQEKTKKRTWLRPVLLLAGPILVVLVGAVVYLTGGRYVSTDDAYIKATRASIAAQVSGPIVQVAVKQNAQVAAGALLFKIDDGQYRNALARADAQLVSVRGDIESAKASYRQKEEETRLARTTLSFAEKEFDRQQTLARQNAAPITKLDDAQKARDLAQQQLAVPAQQMAQIRAKLDGDPTLPAESISTYESAKATRDAAALDLARTEVHAPFDGIASQVPDLGDYVNAGQPVMAVVASRDIWVEANFKETDLTNVQPGQAVTVKLDTYPDREWRGRVESISQATGAEFAIIPPQNATGNWVKVVQRIPVRVAVDMATKDPAFRAGMSANVEIDTQHRREMPHWAQAMVDLFGGPVPAQAADNPQ